MFSKDKLLTNYPLGDFRHPTRASLISSKERRERSYSVNSQDALWKTQR
jgi:hypothetical protein